MKLHELKNIVKKDWIVQFITRSISGEVYSVSMTVAELYEDWFGDCSLCPENGEYVRCVVFYNNGKGYPLIRTEMKMIIFEELMREIEKIM